MASLTGMTLAEMRAATLAQIRTAIKNRIDTLTKRQLMRLELLVRDWDHDRTVTTTEDEQRTYRPDGQIESHVETMRDVLGQKVGSKRIAWSYYPTHEVDVIETVERDANDAVVTRRRIKHYLDGRQPEAI